MGEGIRFVFRHRLIASTMLLDFFATVFGQAMVILPMFAERLGVGAQGLGLLYSAPAAGSVAVVLVMALLPPVVRQGLVLFVSVAAYGLATIVFGLSRTFPLTVAALAAVGAADTVSTVLRQTLRQRLTPDALRGRMTGVNMIFFIGGPQLGELESGLVAAAIGPALAVAIGGAGVLVTLLATLIVVPALARYRDEPEMQPSRAGG
jgi:hypothetical protein